MMSTTFATDYTAKALPKLMAEFGESAVYTPSGGSPSTITAIINRTSLSARSQQDGTPQYAATAFVKASDVATPKINGDTLAITRRVNDASQTTMSIVALKQQDYGWWELGLQ